jgi:hypothetical protein
VLSAASPTGEPSACPESPRNTRPDTLRVTISSCALMLPALSSPTSAGLSVSIPA